MPPLPVRGWMSGKGSGELSSMNFLPLLSRQYAPSSLSSYLPGRPRNRSDHALLLQGFRMARVDFEPIL